jgi:hypothetical protein
MPKVLRFETNNLEQQLATFIGVAVSSDISDAADRLWAERVGAGHSPDDLDAEDAFIAAYISEHIPLSAAAATFVERYKMMLRTLKIPPDGE